MKILIERISFASWRASLFGVVVVASCCNLCQPARATILTTMYGHERATLTYIFKEATRSIRIRCSYLDDPLILRSLEAASRKGVQVHIIVDALTPQLTQLVAFKRPHFAVYLTANSDKGHIYSFNQRSFALVDSTIEWTGVTKWSSKSWGKENQIIVDSKHFGGYPDNKAFELLRQRSKLVFQHGRRVG